MPLFSANLTLLFTEVPFLDRFEAAAASGFRSVEFMFPYDHEPAAVRDRLDPHGLRLDLFNLPAGDFAGGERGIACLPGREQEFRDGVETAIRYADALGTSKLNCLVGLRDAGVDDRVHEAVLVENLRWAAERIGSTGRTLQVEPLNPVDFPGFFLDSLPRARAVIEAVGSPGLRLQFDIYHVQRTHGDVVHNLRRYAELIGHVQIADAPDRHEPGSGELNFGYILSELDQLGYDGRVGAEYKPSTLTQQTLGWVQANGWRLDA
ncbi:MAG: hydroxypyruvate isomerase [Chloroflexota bacterium]|nr:hydroxypyruvate isomerase [Chloroflexota bacterium]